MKILWIFENSCGANCHNYNENFVVATCKKGMQESNDTAMLSGVRMFISQSAGFTRLIVCRLNASTTLVGFFFIYKWIVQSTLIN